MPHPRAADDVEAIRLRLEELQREKTRLLNGEDAPDASDEIEILPSGRIPTARPGGRGSPLHTISATPAGQPNSSQNLPVASPHTAASDRGYKDWFERQHRRARGIIDGGGNQPVRPGASPPSAGPARTNDESIGAERDRIKASEEGKNYGDPLGRLGEFNLG